MHGRISMLTVLISVFVFDSVIFASPTDEEINNLLKTDISSTEQVIAAQKKVIEKGESAVKLLIAALSGKDINVRFNAAYCLGVMKDKRAVKPLIAALNDSDERIRAVAASALGQIGDKAAVRPLIHFLNDEKTSVRSYSAIALAKIGDPRAVEPLIAALWPPLRNPKEFRPLPGGIVLALCMMKNHIRDLHQEGALEKINKDNLAFGYDQKKWQKWWDDNKEKYLQGDQK